MGRKTLEERFWEKVDRRGPDECWPWTGAVSSTGYGNFGQGGMHRQVGAHRIAFVLSGGVIPPGSCVCHGCDNRACCNPAHLFLGSDTDNVQDMIRKERHGRMKLTAAKVREIRERYEAGNVTHRSLACEYGVEHRNIGRIVRRERWAWVE